MDKEPETENMHTQQPKKVQGEGEAAEKFETKRWFEAIGDNVPYAAEADGSAARTQIAILPWTNLTEPRTRVPRRPHRKRTGRNPLQILLRCRVMC